MKEKLSINNCVHEQKPGSAATRTPAACDFPDKINLTAHGDRERKTWCSYMENGFRETAELLEKEVSPLLPDRG